MKIQNPLQMHDWKITDFLSVVLIIQFLVWGTIAVDSLGFHIPIIRQAVCFIYLCFIPGFLVMRIFHLHKLKSIEAVLYALGLSLFVLMFIVFSIDLTFPQIGISKPLALLPLVLTISIVILFLCLACYLNDRDSYDCETLNFRELLSPKFLFLCVIPFLSIFGAYLVNFYNNNVLLMLMIIIISILVLLIGFDKLIASGLYPMSLWVITISLLWHNSLSSSYIHIYDMVLEYQYTQDVIINCFWDWTLPHSYNAVLSNVIIAPIFHEFCNIDLTWIFKIIYPLIFSFVPLGLFSVFQKHFSDKLAFLSCFFFVSMQAVYTTIIGTTKQSIAEVYLVLLLMILLNENIAKLPKSLLLIIFSMSLIVSHYGTSYLVFASIVFVIIFLYMFNVKFLKKKFPNFLPAHSDFVSVSFIMLYLVFIISWYIYVSDSTSFISVVNIFRHIFNTIYEEFFSLSSSRGMAFLVKQKPSFLFTIHKSFHLIIQFFIGICIFSLFSKKELRLNIIYLGFSLYWFLINLLAIAVSGFAVMDPSRLYHLSLFLLAPLASLGCITILIYMFKFFKRPWTSQSTQKVVKGLYIFFTVYFLMNVGFVQELCHESFNSVSLSKDSVKMYGNDSDIGKFYFNYMEEQDVLSAIWLNKHIFDVDKILVYATLGHGQGKGSLLSYGMIPSDRLRMLNNNTTNMATGAYIYLHYFNVVESIGYDDDKNLGIPVIYNIENIRTKIQNKNKIYSNAGSEILKV